MSTVYRVGQINAYIKNMFAQDFLLNRVSVKGEISNCKYHTSGHIYFSLKDDAGSISCIMFAGARKNLTFRMENGQKVVISGSISVYERDGTYRLYAREIRQDGLGELYEKYEALKKELFEMGMFSPEYKQAVPKYAGRIGVVTAPTGAAVRDIINIARRRNPGIQIILYPAKVQGEGAAESIVRGIEMLDRPDIDTIIVGRGGGSIEDLWAFNEEIVARAVFACSTPVISAVGHETDTTICDYVADLRAPTPSAGAELAVADMSKVQETLSGCEDRLRTLMEHRLDDYRRSLQQYMLRLRLSSPESRLREYQLLLGEKEDRLRRAMDSSLNTVRQQLLICMQRMKGASPLLRLEQGYAYLSDSGGHRITAISQVQEGDRIDVRLADGHLQTEIISIKPEYSNSEGREE